MADLSVLNNEAVVVGIALLIGLYASMVRVKLPAPIVELFKNNIFRVVFLSLLLIYRFEKAPHVAVIVALVFVLTMYFINQQERRENFEYVKAITRGDK